MKADAADRLDFDEVENLISRVEEVETEIAAQTKMLRARNALMRGRAEQAFTILCAAADSFASLSLLAQSQRRIAYADILYQHGLRYGGAGIKLAITMLKAALPPLSAEQTPALWAITQNNLGNALANQASRSQGFKGTAQLEEAVIAPTGRVGLCGRGPYSV